MDADYQALLSALGHDPVTVDELVMRTGFAPEAVELRAFRSGRTVYRTPLGAEIETRLAEAGQMLPVEPPHFGATATLGGTIACNLSGPRRPYTGAARDFVLGTRIINGKGEILRFGGEVMKNVAGYDVSRLMTGALGSTFVAQKYWDSFAIGGSLVGIPVVIGENVVGVDLGGGGVRHKPPRSQGERHFIAPLPQIDNRICAATQKLGRTPALVARFRNG